MSNIFKFYYNNNKIENIYVFAGEIIYTTKKSREELKDIFLKNDKDDIFSNIFDDMEIRYIKNYKINVDFVDDIIYNDDTIEMVKFKLLKVIPEYSFDELYFYSYFKEKKDLNIIYQDLTHNNTIPLTKNRLLDFLNNIDKDNEFAKLPNKDIYTYDDLMEIDIEYQIIKKSIGQRFIGKNNDLVYTINPFQAIKYDSILERSAQDIISTNNKNLLFEYEIINNTIYFVFFKDVYEYNNTQLDVESTIKIYFPYLFNNKITSFEKYNQEKMKLLSKTQNIITSENFLNYNSSINLFYNLYNQDLLKYIEYGIKYIEFNIHPINKFNFPLDIIFKLLHVSKSMPLMKYNPGKRQENIFKLYSENKSINGKKIPYLNKAQIFKIMKNIGNSKSVSMYILKDDIPIFYEIYNNATINVKVYYNTSNDLIYTQKLITETLNPLIKVLHDNIQQSGYTFNNFQNILTNNIEILAINYFASVEITKNIDLTQIKSCVSNIFNIIQYNLSSGISMRYKRVSNYNEMNAIDSNIVELIKREYKETEIINNLVDNYKLSEADAKMKLADTISNLQLVQNLFQNKKLKIKNNPGFLITIDKDKFKNNILINISNIDNINYLNHIPILINSIIRITQKQNIEPDELNKISELCKDKAIKTRNFTEDIVANAEKEFVNQTDELNDEINVDLSDDEDGDNLIDILLGDDDDDDDDGIEIGDEEIKFGEEEIEFGDEEIGFGEEEIEFGDEEIGSDKMAGVNSDDDDLQDFTGKNIANPSPFFKKLRELEPTLFLTETDSKYKAFSRICPSNIKRQPVILTQQEKEKIDREHPGSYEQAMEYGSDKNNKYWYICPRYWSLKDNVSLTQEQVDSGKYGNIIPQDAKIVPPGGNIYEFNDSTYHRDKDGNYKNLYPGFMKADSHPDGLCIPCCFKTWDTPSQLKRRKECMEDMQDKKEPKRSRDKKVDDKLEDDKLEDDKLEDDKLEDREDNEKGEVEEGAVKDKEEVISKQDKISNTSEKSKIDEYIKGHEKFPLDKSKWGYLPMAIQIFLNFDNRKCYVSKLNTNLKPFYTCLLRRGVDQNKNYSFLSCIAETYKEGMSIANFKKILIDLITIDKFANYNNGNLIHLFKSKKIDIESESPSKKKDREIEKFNNSFIYKNIDVTNSDHNKFLKTIIRSYGNFISYLEDDDSIIDHTYLWDIICKPDKDLFPEGINLIIFEINNTDITNNVNIICPTNNYSNNYFNIDKKCLLLIKQGNYYEPIYAVEDTKLKYNVTKLFNLKNRELLPDLKKVLMKIKDALLDNCLPKPSINVVEFSKNISLEVCMNILIGLKYEIDSQVVDYNQKVIGIMVSRDKIKGFVPVYPSAISLTYETPIIFMDDVEWSDYTTTKTFLEEIYKESKNRINCVPRVKIIENDMIVGFLTNANQFIQLKDPEMDVYDDNLTKISDTNYIIADKKIQTANSTDLDKERVSMMQNILLETDFYKFFRNIIRRELSKSENRTQKNSVQEIIDNPAILYIEKLSEIDKILRDLSKDSIIFSEMSKKTLESIKTITECNNKNEKDCSKLTYCMLKSGKKCVQIIPKINLINKLDNEEVYYAKIADELIRYNRIKQFILEPENYLTLSKITYELNDNEILIIQSLLTQEYFDQFIPSVKNKYIENTTYDTVNPDKTKFYSNKGDLDKKTKKEKTSKDDEDEDDRDDSPEKVLEITDSGCSLTKKQLIGYLQEEFPPRTSEIYYKTHLSICSYEIILNIMRDYNKDFERLSIHALKKNMVDIYATYKDDIKMIIILLIELNKKVVLEKVLDKVVTFDDMLLSDEYYLTYIDMILIAKYYKLPIVLISSMPILGTMSDETIIIPNKIDTKKWYFIKVPSIVTRVKKQDYPIYKLLTYSNKLSIDIDEVSEKLRENIKSELTNPRDILSFLIENIKPKKKYRLKIIDKIKSGKEKFKIVDEL